MDVTAYIAKTDILDKLGINFRFCDESFEGLVDDEIERSVFQATFAPFGKGRTDGTGDDYVIRVLLSAVVDVSVVQGS